MPKRVRPWTKEEDEFMLQHYGYGQLEFCCESLHRSEYDIEVRARKLGFQSMVRRFTEDEKRIIREMNAKGCLDTEIAAALGRTVYESVSRLRKKMGLPCRYLEHASRLSTQTNAKKRQKIRDFAAEYNLPTYLRMREVMIVVLLAHRPRLTPAQIADRLNITVGHLHSRLYLSTLKNQGLIHSVRVSLSHFYSITPACMELLRSAGGAGHVGVGNQTTDAVEGLGEDEAAGGTSRQ